MRVSRGLIGLAALACSSQEPAPVEPSASERPAPIKVAVLPEGMIRVGSGTVALGPRHLPPVEGTPPPPLPIDGAASPPDAQGESLGGRPWRSAGGRGFPRVRVSVSGFLVDRTEVTRGAYARFIEAAGYRPPHVAEDWAEDGWNWNGAHPPEGTEDHPVVLVSFYDADAYCRWAGKRLPTEAEWQLAALGTEAEGRHYPWGNVYDGSRFNHGRTEAPNFDPGDGYARTAPVGSYPGGNAASGIQDAYGNAWEFTSDLRVESLQQLSHTSERGGVLQDAFAAGPGLRVAVRGGSFYFDLRPNPGSEWAAFVPEVRRKSTGFRCARDAI